MHSYSAVYNFPPEVSYRPLEALIPQIDASMFDQNVLSVVGEEGIPVFREHILRCMQVYYRLAGIDNEVINAKGAIDPQGILPRYAESLITYFKDLEKKVPEDKEISILKDSGVNTIKVRYKYTDSVIKKLIKLGLKDPKIFADPLQIFLKGGALHDLIGIQFVCSYPYEKEWVTRTLYNFFEYDNRTDDHLLYGFYRVEKKSGYRGLHCDRTLFNPRFEPHISKEREAAPLNLDTVLTVLDPEDSVIEILRKCKTYFNVEIQLHTNFENLWSSMEHTNNYNIQAKGSGRNSKITVQWKMLADNLKTIEEQFQQLQIDTEQTRFEVLHHSGYIPIKSFLEELGSDTYSVHLRSEEKVKALEDLLRSHEISRQDYVKELQAEVRFVDAFSLKQEDPSVRIIFDMHAAFIYYGLASQSKYFNSDDIRQFVKKTLNRYANISTFLSRNENIHKGKLINTIAVFRYLYLGQKHGYGLINSLKENFIYSDVSTLNYANVLTFFETGISLFNTLNGEELQHINSQSANTIKILHHYDMLAREWELFHQEEESLKSKQIQKSILQFREQFINRSLYEKFNTLLESDKIKNVGFVVRFYTMMVWHGFLRPRDALKQIIKYSAYDKIRASDLFYYELSAYHFLVTRRCVTVEDCMKRATVLQSDTEQLKHYENYHRKNMIHLLFKINKSESSYKFNKARHYFEQLTQTQFTMDHFSGMISKEES